LIIEVGLAIPLIVASALMVQTVLRLQTSDFGFRPQNLLVTYFSLQTQNYSRSAPLLGFFRSVLDRVRALPGVQAADISSNLPLQPYLMRISFDREGAPTPDPTQRPTINYQMIGPGYLSALRIPLLQGRNLTDADGPESPPVALINASFARAYFADENPLGKRLELTPPLLGQNKLGARTAIEIVGVIGDTNAVNMTTGAHFSFVPAKPPPEMYVPFWQNQWSGTKMLLVRTAGNPSALAPAVRAAIAAADKDLPIGWVGSMEDVLYLRAATPRFRARLMGAFSVLAILLASAGVYSLTAFSVTQRTREFGIRIALGAHTPVIVRAALQPTLLLTIAGIAVGLLTALAASRLVSAFLYGVSPTDPLTIASAALCFTVLAVVAGWIPAWRATRIDPVRTLRQE
jgi:putative ABC transport system permease protein